MKNRIALSLLTILLATNGLMAQGGGQSSNWFMYLLLAMVVLLFFLIFVRVSDSMLAIEAKRLGIEDGSKDSFSLFSSFGDLFPTKRPEHLSASAPFVKLTKGHDILLEGAAEGAVQPAQTVTTYAVSVPDFIGISPIPKVTVEVGDNVKAGDVLFYDKKKPEIQYVAPVSGEVIEITRGEKRSIKQIIILADKKQQFKSNKAPQLNDASREEIVNYLLETGAWTLLRQRPYNVTPEPSVVPRDVYISTFDTAPLAPNSNVVLVGKEAAFQKGLDVLAALTSGSVNLGMNAKDATIAKAYTDATGVNKIYFDGKHPAGNVGVQIHNTKPIASGEVIWTLGVQEVATLGELFLSGNFDASRVVALTGAELKAPKYVSTYAGARLGELLKDNMANDHSRIISGDVLSGSQRDADSFLGYFDDQVTVVEEGDDYEMFGWLLPLKPRPSVSGTFPNKIFTDLVFKADTNTHGEQRAFVMTGLYEKMLPMDIYPQQLMKSIMINDMEAMEGLGIFELVEEDVALAEFACVSKQPLQSILRDGLDRMREEG